MSFSRESILRRRATIAWPSSLFRVSRNDSKLYFRVRDNDSKSFWRRGSKCHVVHRLSHPCTYILHPRTQRRVKTATYLCDVFTYVAFCFCLRSVDLFLPRKCHLGFFLCFTVVIVVVVVVVVVICVVLVCYSCCSLLL